MRKFFCDFCGEHIPDEIIAKRHLSEARMKIHFCNKAHLAAWRKQTGFFKEMSLKGREKRKKAVAASNKKHPRRRKTNNS